MKLFAKEPITMSLRTLPDTSAERVKHPIVITRGKYSVGLYHGATINSKATQKRLRKVGFREAPIVLREYTLTTINLLVAHDVMVDGFGKYSVILEYSQNPDRLMRITLYKPEELKFNRDELYAPPKIAHEKVLQTQFKIAPNATIKPDFDDFKVPYEVQYFDFGTCQVRPPHAALHGVEGYLTATYLQVEFCHINGYPLDNFLCAYRFTKAIEVRFIY